MEEKIRYIRSTFSFNINKHVAFLYSDPRETQILFMFCLIGSYHDKKYMNVFEMNVFGCLSDFDADGDCCLVQRYWHSFWKHSETLNEFLPPVCANGFSRQILRPV